MKKIYYPIMLVAVIFAFYEQNKPQPNQLFSFLGIAVFIFGLSKLMASVPSKNEEEHTQFYRKNNDDFDENEASKSEK